MQTYTGLCVVPGMQFTSSLVRIEDIARSLSHKCRFGGHCKTFYSVAQHCVLGAGLLVNDALLGERRRALGINFLLHDAPEAYGPDFCAPHKKDYLMNLRVGLFTVATIESYILKQIRMAFAVTACDQADEQFLKSMDLKLRATERKQLMVPVEWSWGADEIVEPFNFVIKPWEPEQAMLEYLSFFAYCMDLHKGGAFANPTL